MKSILPSRMKRQLEIVELLFENDWLTIQAISENLSVPSKTIKSDLTELETLIAPATLEHSNQYGITLSLQSNVSRATIFKRFLHNSTEFQLIEQIFLHSFDSISELADSLFISISTVKRIVTRVNKPLQLEGFTLRLKNMQLIGDPHSIFHFMRSYFLEKYYTAEQLLTSRQLDILDKIITDVITETSPEYISSKTDFSLLNNLRISAYTAIMLLISNNDELFPHLQEKQFQFLTSKTLCDEFYSQFKLKLTCRSITDILYLFFNEKHVHSTTDLLKQIETDHKQQQKYDKLKQLIKHIEKRTTQPLANKSAVLLSLYNLDNQIHNRTFILYDQNKHFFFNLKHMYGSFIQELVHSFQAIYYAAPHKEYVVYEALRILFMEYPSLFNTLEDKIPKLNAGLFFIATSQYNEVITKKLNYHFKNYYHFTPVNVSSIAELSEATTAYDCIVTNIPDIELENTLVVVLPTAIDTDSYDKLMLTYEQYTQQPSLNK